jgi:hypothetical protein
MALNITKPYKPKKYNNMARQRDSKLVGTVGNIIFYNSCGEYCMRAKPVSVRRTKASVNSGFDFGKASKISGQIRKLVAPINPARSDIKVLYRLTGAVNKFISWNRNRESISARMPPKLPFIYRFQFNDQADLSVIRSIEPIIMSPAPGVIEINFAPLIPDQSLHAPAKTANISLKMMLISANLNDTQTGLLGKSEIQIPLTSEIFQIPPINAAVPNRPGDLVILITTVQYMVIRNGVIEMLTDKKKQPCGITCAGLEN